MKFKFKRTKKKQERTRKNEKDEFGVLGKGTRHDLDVRGGRLILCLLIRKSLSDNAGRWTLTPFEWVM